MRSRFLLPIETVHLQLLATPFINNSLQLGTPELLSKNNKQNPTCVSMFSPSVYSLSPFTSFFFFFKLPSIAFCSTPTHNSLPPFSLQLTLNLASAGPDLWFPPLCESVREAVCMCVRMSPL